MFSASQNYPVCSLDDIKSSMQQEALFAKYTGIWPDLHKSYHSIFRSDRRPGCRFRWHNGLLFFIDNASFKNKLAFNIVDIVSILNNCSYREALQIISSENDIIVAPIVGSTINKDIAIRFEHTDWKDNIFSLSNDVLHEENVFNVTKYWIRIEGNWTCMTKNCIAYYFPDSDHTKLYFQDQITNRWFTNCDSNDVYGIDRLQFYYERDPSKIIITKSQKDRLVLDYHMGLNAIALQHEKTFINTDVRNMLDMFDKKIIVFDNDRTGIERSEILSDMYGYDTFIFEKYKDAYDNYINKYFDDFLKLKEK